MSFENSKDFYPSFLTHVERKNRRQRHPLCDLIEEAMSETISNGMPVHAGAAISPALLTILKSKLDSSGHPMPKGDDLRIIRLDAVIKKVGLSRSTIYNLIKKGDFPDRVGLGQRSMGFYEHEIDDWILKLGRSA